MSRIVLPAAVVLNNIPLGPGSTGAAAGGVVDLFPWTDFSWADELTMYIIVTSINGSPTAGGLTAKFQLGTPFVTGAVGQFVTQALFDMDSAQKATLIAEGEDWPNPIVSYNSTVNTNPISATNPLVVKRTIRNFGALCSLHLDTSTLSSGASFNITVVLIQKGH